MPYDRGAAARLCRRRKYAAGQATGCEGARRHKKKDTGKNVARRALPRAAAAAPGVDLAGGRQTQRVLAARGDADDVVRQPADAVKNGALVVNRRVDLYAIDATPARWRGDAGSCNRRTG